MGLGTVSVSSTAFLEQQSRTPDSRFVRCCPLRRHPSQTEMAAALVGPFSPTARVQHMEAHRASTTGEERAYHVICPSLFS